MVLVVDARQPRGSRIRSRTPTSSVPHRLVEAAAHRARFPRGVRKRPAAKRRSAT